ncbi:DUF421 domain-containing protein [Dongia deserti]|uniref:DUF421 domain-containing protein n=1 Tax=Dongia deserti TaxID=2268030 RepID=UPI000E64F29E|nr:YetF domain-containing protein [Dongia deserti]
MDAVLRTVAVYGFLLVVLRISGRRTLAQMTTFDFVLLLIISEATQQALLGDDFSITNALVIIATLLAIDVGLSLIKGRVPASSKLIDGLPMIVVENGAVLEERLRHARIDESDILESARETQGLESIDQIKFAVLEITGSITVIPKDR